MYLLAEKLLGLLIAIVITNNSKECAAFLFLRRVALREAFAPA
jgi:hypothetical protein